MQKSEKKQEKRLYLPRHLLLLLLPFVYMYWYSVKMPPPSLSQVTWPEGHFHQLYLR